MRLVRGDSLIPACVAVPQSIMQYFQQLRPASQCDAEDGRVVGQLLVDLVESKPKDLAHAIRTFVNRTAMIRECGCRHIGTMLAHLLSAAAQGPDDDATIEEDLDPSSVTEKQAAAIGSAIASSTHRSRMPATAVLKVVNSQPVLIAMKSRYPWFGPMLEVLLNPRAVEGRRSSLVKRLSSIDFAEVNLVAPINVNAADVEISFSSVVRLQRA